MNTITPKIYQRRRRGGDNYTAIIMVAAWRGIRSGIFMTSIVKVDNKEGRRRRRRIIRRGSKTWEMNRDQTLD